MSTTDEIANIFDRHAETVRRAIRRYRKGGIEARKTCARIGRPRKVTKEIEKLLEEAVRVAPI